MATWTQADKLAIRAELANDPKALGLTTNAADDESNSVKLNQVRSTIKVKRRSVAVKAVFEVINKTEHTAMGPQDARWFTDFLALGQFDAFLDANTVAGLFAIFNETLTQSGPRIAALLVEDGSRLNELYQGGIISTPADCTPSNVADARQAV